MIFAPGTPQSVIKAAEQAYRNRPKIDKTAPVRPIKPTQPMPTKPGVNPPPRGPRGVGPTDGPSRPMPAPTTPPPPVKPSAPPMPVGPGAGAMGGGMPPAGNVQQTVSGGPPPNYGGMTMKKGGKVASAPRRGDGIAQRGKTKGRFI